MGAANQDSSYHFRNKVTSDNDKIWIFNYVFVKWLNSVLALKNYSQKIQLHGAEKEWEYIQMPLPKSVAFQPSKFGLGKVDWDGYYQYYECWLLGDNFVYLVSLSHKL